MTTLLESGYGPIDTIALAIVCGAASRIGKWSANKAYWKRRSLSQLYDGPSSPSMKGRPRGLERYNHQTATDVLPICPGGRSSERKMNVQAFNPVPMNDFGIPERNR